MSRTTWGHRYCHDLATPKQTAAPPSARNASSTETPICGPCWATTAWTWSSTWSEARIWAAFLDVLPRGGRYAIAGAIGEALTRIDLRTLYLKDLTLLGCTFQVEAVIANLIQYIENGDIRPSVAAT